MRPTSCCRRGLSAAFVALAIAAVAPAAAGAAPSSTAPGAPGAKAFWTPADKQGFGTSMTTQSKVWHTLQGGELTEVYYPRPRARRRCATCSSSSPTARRSPSARPTRPSQHVELADKRSLTYRQVNTAKSGRYRIVKTYVTDPARNALLVDVRFQSLTGRPYQVYAYVDPALSNDGNDDSGTTSHGALLDPGRHGGQRARRRAVLRRAPRPATWAPATAGPTCATTTAWTGSTARSPNGNVVQTGRRRKLDGRRAPAPARSRSASAPPSGAALATARASLQRGFGRAAGALRRRLAPLPRLAQAPRRPARSPIGAEYDESVDGPGRPRGQDLPRRLHRLADDAVGVGNRVRVPQSGAYHLVWSRDLYQIATALMAAGDRGAAERALSFVFDKQQRPTARFPQNTFVDGTPHWDGTCSSTRSPSRSSSPGSCAATTRRPTPARQAGGRLARHRPGPQTPTGALGEPGRLVAGHDRLGDRRAGLRRRPRARATATTRARPRYEQTADTWQKSVESWTADHQRPVLRQALLPAPDQGRQPERRAAPTRSATAGRARSTSARSSTRASSSSCASASSPRRPDDPQHDRRRRPAARRRHPQRALLAPLQLRRLRRDSSTAEPWDSFPAGQPAPRRGRAWPIFAGERGEYDLAAGDARRTRAARRDGRRRQRGRH